MQGMTKGRANPAANALHEQRSPVFRRPSGYRYPPSQRRRNPYPGQVPPVTQVFAAGALLSAALVGRVTHPAPGGASFPASASSTSKSHTPGILTPAQPIGDAQLPPGGGFGNNEWRESP